MLSYLRKRISVGESGATAVEYALLVAAIAIVMVVAAFTLGGAIRDKFTQSATCVQSLSAPACPA